MANQITAPYRHQWWGWPARLAALVVAAGLAGCGAAQPTPRLIEMVWQTTYRPSSLALPAGGTIVWHNTDTVVHSVVAADSVSSATGGPASVPAGAAPFDSGDLAPGDTWAYTFTTAGEYVFLCRYHVDEQMLGVITITAPP